MIKKQVGKLSALGTAIGLALGGVLTIAFPPAGSIVILSVLAGASGGAAVGAAIGGAVGESIDQINIAQRERVIQIFGPKEAGKNSVFNTLTGQTKKPQRSNSNRTEHQYYRDENNHEVRKYELEILKTDDQNVIVDRFRETIEVSGEKIDSWEKVILDTNPHGIIYVIQTPSFAEKRERANSLEKDVEGILAIENALQKITQKRVTAFIILLNKIDLVEARGADPSIELREYRKQLLQYKTPRGTIEDLLRATLGKDTPIRTHWFCADWEIKTQYNAYSKLAIQDFVDDLHRDKTK